MIKFVKILYLSGIILTASATAIKEVHIPQVTETYTTLRKCQAGEGKYSMIKEKLQVE